MARTALSCPITRARSPASNRSAIELFVVGSRATNFLFRPLLTISISLSAPASLTLSVSLRFCLTLMGWSFLSCQPLFNSRRLIPIRVAAVLISASLMPSPLCQLQRGFRDKTSTSSCRSRLRKRAWPLRITCIGTAHAALRGFTETAILKKTFPVTQSETLPSRSTGAHATQRRRDRISLRASIET